MSAIPRRSFNNQSQFKHFWWEREPKRYQPRVPHLRLSRDGFHGRNGLPEPAGEWFFSLHFHPFFFEKQSAGFVAWKTGTHSSSRLTRVPLVFFFFLLSADHQTEYRQQPVRQRIIRDSSRHSDFERWATLWWQKRVVDRLISGPTQGNTSSCLLSEPLRRAIDHRSLEDISVQIESNVATNEPGNRLLSSPFYTENCFRVSLICGGCGTAVEPCRDFR